MKITEYKDPQYADHLERKVGACLTKAAIEFIHESQNKEVCKGLDFCLPNYGVFIEVKQFHSDRIKDQLMRADNIIVLQGKDAVTAFCDFILLPNLL